MADRDCRIGDMAFGHCIEFCVFYTHCCVMVRPCYKSDRLGSLPCDGDVAIPLGSRRCFRAVFPLPLGGTRLIVVGWRLRSGLLEVWIMVRVVVHDYAPEGSLFVVA